MLKRIAIALLITILALALIDRASLFVAPCGPGGGSYSDQKGYEKDDCATHEGIIVAGIEWLFDSPPEIWTALASLMIAVFTGTLWYSTDKLWRSGEKQIRLSRAIALRQRLDTQEQLRIAKEAADAAKDAAEASAQQVKIAENALTQLERPYVFIFGVRGIKQDKSSQEFFVEYTVANYGKMPAIIEAPHIGFEISERAEPPMPPLLHDAHNLMATPILQAGEVRKKIRCYLPTGMVGEDINAVIDTVRARDIDPNTLIGDGVVEEVQTVMPTFTFEDGFDLFFRAVISYRGPFTRGHETGAVWLYSPGTFEFAVRGGEEHNYIK